VAGSGATVDKAERRSPCCRARPSRWSIPDLPWVCGRRRCGCHAWGRGYPLTPPPHGTC
jgi:hypothetical protein